MTKTLSFPAHIIEGRGISEGDGMEPVNSVDPYNGERAWSAGSAGPQTVNKAVEAARKALPTWRGLPLKKRAACIERFTEIVQKRAIELAQMISRESGKPLWDAKTEVNSLITKLAATSEAYEKRAGDSSREVRGLTSRTRFLPHGVMAVLGPFNFPMSMANSHIMPALYAGNTVVFKPSERTPLCGLMVSQIWQEAGLPAGVLNCVSGGAQTGRLLVEHSDVNGVLFIGSHRGGLGILRALVEYPEKIVALEMGGNSSLVVWDYEKVDVAAHIALQSSIVTAGQRCSAARRLIIPRSDNKVIERLVQLFKNVRIGHYSESAEPFYGPLIRPEAAAALMQRSQELIEGGAEPLLAPTTGGPINTLVTPGILDVTRCKNDADEEIFGPLLKVIRVDSLDEALAVSNKTRFGLATGIVTRDRKIFDKFFGESRAGIVNWNQQLTGATTFAPFGGVKQSGNYRPAGYLSVDYCSYSVASFEIDRPKLPDSLSPGIRL